MARYLGEKASVNRLQAFIEKHWSKDENDEMGFYNDIFDEDEWTWRFELGEVSHSLTLNRHTGKIEHKSFKAGYFNIY